MAAMTFFVVAFYSSLLLSNFTASQGPDKAENAAETARVVKELKEKEAVVRERLLAQPDLLSAVSYAFLAVLCWGLYLDTRFLRRLRRGELWADEALERPVPGWGVPEVGGAFVFLLFAEACFFLLHAAHHRWGGSGEELPEALMFAASLLRNLFVILFVWALIKKKYGQGLRELGLRSGRTLKNVWKGLTGYVAVLPPLLLTFAALAVALKVFSIEAMPQNVVQTYLKESANSYLIPLTIFVALLGPVLEEFFFRGFAYAGLKKHFGVWGSACVSSAAFAALHMNAVVFAPIFVLGIFLSYLYESSGSLVPSITAHMLHNGIMVALTLSFKGLSA